MDEIYVVKIENDLPTKGIIRYENFRALYPSTSFPETPTLELLAAFGYAPWMFTPQPFPAEKRVVIEDDPLLIDGLWHQRWTDRAMNAEELAVATEQKFAEVRAIRTNYLYECDWTQLPDAPITTEKKAEWTAYRQALRDLPDIVTDPFNVTWPQKP